MLYSILSIVYLIVMLKIIMIFKITLQHKPENMDKSVKIGVVKEKVHKAIDMFIFSIIFMICNHILCLISFDF